MLFETRRSPQTSHKTRELTGRILLADPNPLDLETYTDVLRYFGHEVRSCPSYEQARRILQLERFDLVILGQSSARFAGREVLEQLHTEADRTPSLVLSWDSGADSCVQAISLGAADCIGKPVPPQRLRHAVDACLLPQTAEVGCSRPVRAN